MKKLIALFAVVVLSSAFIFAQAQPAAATNNFTLSVICQDWLLTPTGGGAMGQLQVGIPFSPINNTGHWSLVGDGQKTFGATLVRPTYAGLSWDEAWTITGSDLLPVGTPWTGTQATAFTGTGGTWGPPAGFYQQTGCNAQITIDLTLSNFAALPGIISGSVSLPYQLTIVVQ